jgi:aspartate racemase
MHNDTQESGEKERMVLIGGGVGPMAGVELHRKIIEQTATDGTDQDHLEVIHLSRSPVIGDRTDYLLGKEVADPVEGMLRVFRMAAGALELEGRQAVGGIPCNTFHAPAIFEPFSRRLEEEQHPIRLLHMLEETAETIRELAPGARRIGLLSTTGTRKSGVYEEILGRHGLELILIPEEEQERLHEAIYHRSWGLKAVSPAAEEAVERVKRAGRILEERGAEAVILGCTELPLALPEGRYGHTPYIDPMTVLARALVREAAPSKLKPRGG